MEKINKVEKTTPELTFKGGKVVDAVMLNIRERPSIDAPVKVVLLRDAEVTVDLRYTNKEWYKVKTATGDSGYAIKDYIAIKE